jgi:hypothetical protein
LVYQPSECSFITLLQPLYEFYFIQVVRIIDAPT